MLYDYYVHCSRSDGRCSRSDGWETLTLIFSGRVIVQCESRGTHLIFVSALGVKETTNTPLRCQSPWFLPVMVSVGMPGMSSGKHTVRGVNVYLFVVWKGEIFPLIAFDLEGRRQPWRRLELIVDVYADRGWGWFSCDIPSYCVDCWTILGRIVVAKVCNGKDSFFVCMYVCQCRNTHR